MMQIPNLPNCPQLPQQPNYNAVKIDVHNPMVNVPVPNSQYAVPTMPYYNYPQATTQPYYMPPVITTPDTPQTPVVVPPVVNQQQTVPSSTEVPVTPNVAPPAPVVTENVNKDENKQDVKPEVDNQTPQVENKEVEVVPPQEVKPDIDLNAFLAKLNNPDFDVQASAMSDIADMVDKDAQKATQLLDTDTINALVNIITKDTSNLTGPSAEIDAARDAINKNSNLSDEQKMAELEKTLTDKEKAERNKSYALFTTAILQKLYSSEQEKLTNSVYPLTEIPGAVTVVQQLKGNPNPVVRTSAIEALSYIQQPNYKKDLNTIFTIAQKDSDPRVQEAANLALTKLNELPDVQEHPANTETTAAQQQAA